MSLLISNSHINVLSSLYSVYYTNFIGCTENEGGAIYSNFNGNCAILANSCFFTNCSAIGDSGRGSAIRIMYGSTIVQKCCLSHCISSFGGDIQTSSQSNGIICTNVQTFEDIHKYHPTMYGGKIIDIIFTNFTSHMIMDDSMKVYGNVFCTASNSKVSIKYLNGITCSGHKSVIFSQNTASLSITNAYIINNQEIEYLIALDETSTKNSVIDIQNSSFLGIACRNYYFKPNSMGLVIKFNKCTFCMEQIQSKNDIVFEECLYVSPLEHINSVIGQCTFPHSKDSSHICQQMHALDNSFVYILLFPFIS